MSIFSTILILLAFLFPVALYLAFLSTLNRRAKPLMISGFADCAALLFALAGFLLVVVPALISLMYRLIVEALLFGDSPPVANSFDVLWALSWIIWVLYYAGVVGGAIYALTRSSHKTIIYNVEPTIFDELLTHSLSRIGFAATRQGTRWTIAPGGEPVQRDNVDVIPISAAVTATPPLPKRTGAAELDVDVFPALCNVTLRWVSATPDGLEREIELELQKDLAEVRTNDNPAAGWIVGATTFLSILLFLGVAFLYMVLFLPGLRR